MENDHRRSAEGNAHNSMAITVEGHLHFARGPDIQVALKTKQLLGTYLTAGK